MNKYLYASFLFILGIMILIPAVLLGISLGFLGTVLVITFFIAGMVLLFL